MSAVIAAPELMAEATTDLAAIGSTISAAHLLAAGPTATVLPAAADEVSASIAQLFSLHAHDCHVLAGQTAVFHEQFVQNLTARAGSNADAEAANAASLQPAAAIGDVAARAAGTFQGPLLNLFDAAVSQLLNVLTSLWNKITLAFAGFAMRLIIISLILLLAPPFLALFFYRAANGGPTSF